MPLTHVLLAVAILLVIIGVISLSVLHFRPKTFFTNPICKKQLLFLFYLAFTGLFHDSEPQKAQRIKSPVDFEWLKQSRFYYKEDEDKCVVSITDVNFKYMNEYLGCIERLVITPLTDRLLTSFVVCRKRHLSSNPYKKVGYGSKRQMARVKCSIPPTTLSAPSCKAEVYSMLAAGSRLWTSCACLECSSKRKS